MEKNIALDTSHTNVNETNKQDSNYEILKRTEVEGTPFIIITKENKHFGTFGKYRITEIETDFDKLNYELKNFSWHRMIQIMGLIIEITNEK